MLWTMFLGNLISLFVVYGIVFESWIVHVVSSLLEMGLLFAPVFALLVSLIVLLLILWISYYKIWRKMGGRGWLYFLPFVVDVKILNILGGSWILFLQIPFFFILFLLGDRLMTGNPMFLLPLYRKGWYWILFFILWFFVYLCSRMWRMCLNLARGFWKGRGFAVGIFFFPFVFLSILAFGKAKWIGMSVGGYDSLLKKRKAIKRSFLPWWIVGVIFLLIRFWFMMLF